jgi:anaerobic selenocysteine-containing dehydrogenase
MPIAICPLCEATCGLQVSLEGDRVAGIRGNPDDRFSAGYLCPKGYALKDLEEDPELREGTTWRKISWDEAFAYAKANLKAYSPEQIGVYLGNPNVHNLAGQLYLPALLRALRTPNIFSASTLDQMPKHVACGLMFGDPGSIPVPDIDHTQFFLVLGANPLVSNGSLMTAPNMKGRLRALKARGGRLVVVDPKRTLTAREADQHLFIRPGTDAFLLMALVHVLLNEGLSNNRLAEHTVGLEQLPKLCQPFAPERVEPICGIAAETIRELARSLAAAASSAAVYGRLGTCTQEFGTLTSWLVEVVNLLTGNLDRVGGAMFPKAAAGARNTQGVPGVGRGLRPGRLRTRVRGLAQVNGELPTAALAEEMLTPGPGQIRCLFTVAGNPALSAPNSERMEKALAGLELMISLDCYRNETTRHAHLILPPPSHLRQSHYDVVFAQLAVRNLARYSPSLLPPLPGQLEEWEVMLRLAGIASGMDLDTKVLDEGFALQLVERELGTPGSRVAGRTARELMQKLAPRVGPERLLDFLLRVGPYNLTLADVEGEPNGIDLGALQPRIPEVLRTPSGKIEAAPEAIVADVARLQAALETPREGLLLIGRRELRSNNSWMHNLPVLTKGPEMCTLQVHPDDALRLKLGDRARISSSSGSLVVGVELCADLMPGVVSLPHGWGHDGSEQRVAGRKPGVNANLLVPDDRVEPLSGNAIQNAVPVTVCAHLD